MPQYIVDLTPLEHAKREEAYALLRDFSFAATRIINNRELEAAQITWNSPEDFESSPIFPKGCSCRIIAY